MATSCLHLNTQVGPATGLSKGVKQFILAGYNIYTTLTGEHTMAKGVTGVDPEFRDEGGGGGEMIDKGGAGTTYSQLGGMGERCKLPHQGMALLLCNFRTFQVTKQSV